MPGDRLQGYVPTVLFPGIFGIFNVEQVISFDKSGYTCICLPDLLKDTCQDMVWGRMNREDVGNLLKLQLDTGQAIG